MLRLAVTFQLVLTLLAGPALCCCASGRLEATGVPSAPRKSCCHGQPTPAESPTPDQPVECPCKVHRLLTYADAKTPTPDADSGVGFDAWALPSASHAPVPALFALLHCEFRTAFLSTADLLFAHHNLRC